MNEDKLKHIQTYFKNAYGKPINHNIVLANKAHVITDTTTGTMPKEITDYYEASIVIFSDDPKIHVGDIVMASNLDSFGYMKKNNYVDYDTYHFYIGNRSDILTRKNNIKNLKQ